MPDVADPEGTGLRFDGRHDEIGLGPARTLDLPGALLEFSTGAADDGEKMIESWKEVVRAFMPALGAFLEDAVVVFFRLFDEPLQADVSAHFIAVLIER